MNQEIESVSYSHYRGVYLIRDYLACKKQFGLHAEQVREYYEKNFPDCKEGCFIQVQQKFEERKLEWPAVIIISNFGEKEVTKFNHGKPTVKIEAFAISAQTMLDELSLILRPRHVPELEAKIKTLRGFLNLRDQK